MDLLGLKEQHLRATLGISKAEFPRILTFVDFANVNHWFERDDKDEEGAPLPVGMHLNVDLQRTAEFFSLFAQDTRFYYGHDAANPRSMAFTVAAKHAFGKNRVFTKPIQKIRHYLAAAEAATNTRAVATDAEGDYIFIPKCNFDVEISVDAIRLSDAYDTICLLSSDADFASLLRYLKGKEKKTILIKGGRISGALGAAADLIISAQDIKKHITVKKQKPGF
jgi:uncharacterized LabA/DUF88 family protein